jgi:hypothetical protein
MKQQDLFHSMYVDDLLRYMLLLLNCFLIGPVDGSDGW